MGQSTTEPLHWEEDQLGSSEGQPVEPAAVQFTLGSSGTYDQAGLRFERLGKAKGRETGRVGGRSEVGRAASFLSRKLNRVIYFDL